MGRVESKTAGRPKSKSPEGQAERQRHRQGLGKGLCGLENGKILLSGYRNTA